MGDSGSTELATLVGLMAGIQGGGHLIGHSFSRGPPAARESCGALDIALASSLGAHLPILPGGGQRSSRTVREDSQRNSPYNRDTVWQVLVSLMGITCYPPETSAAAEYPD